MQFIIVRSTSDIPTDRPVLGIEIPGNRPDLIARCSLGNIDPQHGGGSGLWEEMVQDMRDEEGGASNCAAVQEVLGALHYDAGRWPFGVTSDAVIVFTRVDLDAVATAAILTMRPDQVARLLDDQVIMDRIVTLSAADCFACGAWSGPRPFPTVEEPWLSHGGVVDIEALAAPNWVTEWAARGTIPVWMAVEVITEWVLNGETLPADASPYGEDDLPMLAESMRMAQPDIGPAEILSIARRCATKARIDAIRASRTFHLIGEHRMFPYPNCYDRVNAGDLSVYYPEFIFMDSLEHPEVAAGAGLAYCIAPVSVIRQRDPRSRCVRYSIAAFDAGRFDQRALAAELTRLEHGARGLIASDPSASWGGPARMVGSPQASDSLLTPEQVIAAVRKHLL